MTDIRDRIHELLASSWQLESLSTDERFARRQHVVDILTNQPELDVFFLRRYVTDHVEEWELNLAFQVLIHLGRRRLYDWIPLDRFVHCEGASIHYKRRALTCLCQLFSSLDEEVVCGILAKVPSQLRLTAVCDTIDTLATVTDRGKAARLLRWCLRATDTVEEETFRSVLDCLVNRTEGNEDIFEAVLGESRSPHEVVVLAVSLMKETLPPKGRYRALAEEAAKRSQLADDYLNFYVGRYITKGEPTKGA